MVHECHAKFNWIETENETETENARRSKIAPPADTQYNWQQITNAIVGVTPTYTRTQSIQNEKAVCATMLRVSFSKKWTRNYYNSFVTGAFKLYCSVQFQPRLFCFSHSLSAQPVCIWIAFCPIEISLSALTLSFHSKIVRNDLDKYFSKVETKRTKNETKLKLQPAKHKAGRFLFWICVWCLRTIQL